MRLFLLATFAFQLGRSRSSGWPGTSGTCTGAMDSYWQVLRSGLAAE